MEQKRLYRSVTNRKICGVCGGLGEYFNIDPTLIRLGGVLLACVSCGTAVVAYFVAAVIIPDPGESFGRKYCRHLFYPLPYTPGKPRIIFTLSHYRGSSCI